MTKRIAAGNVRLKRAYEPPARDDGMRILVDRLWPRGVKTADAAIDRWAKDLAPSTELREWFGHDPVRWLEFRRRYAEELQERSDQLRELRALARRQPITLVFSAHDEVHNDAVALRSFLLGGKKKRTAVASVERALDAPRRRPRIRAQRRSLTDEFNRKGVRHED